MINLTKGEFIKMIIRMTATYHEDWTYSKVKSLAQSVYRDSIPEGQGQTDRFVIAGYTVLMDKDVDHAKLRDPEEELTVNFLLPKTGLSEYLREEVKTCGYTGSDVDGEVDRILRSLKRKSKRRTYTLNRI